MSHPPTSSVPWRDAPAELERAYQAACAAVLDQPAGAWACGLHLGAQSTWLAVGAEATAPALLLSLPIGSAKTAQDFFVPARAAPAGAAVGMGVDAYPTPLALENAIAVVEDEVYTAHSRLRALLPPGAPTLQPWSCLSPELQQIVSLAGVALEGTPRRLGRDALEALFNRVAAVAEGRPAAHAGLPDSATWAAALLVLRELMHHLPFEQMRWVASSEGPLER
jgi:hypothetical protein